MFRFCRICSANVPPRKNYIPNFCEACQKFFRRHVERWNQLVCKSGTFDCNVENSRRCCRKCRFEKCVKAGMKSRFFKGKTNSVGDATKNITSLNEKSLNKAIVPVVKCPLSSQMLPFSPNIEIIDQTLNSAERFLRASLIAFNSLLKTLASW